MGQFDSTWIGPRIESSAVHLQARAWPAWGPSRWSWLIKTIRRRLRAPPYDDGPSSQPVSQPSRQASRQPQGTALADGAPKCQGSLELGVPACIISLDACTPWRWRGGFVCGEWGRVSVCVCVCFSRVKSSWLYHFTLPPCPPWWHDSMCQSIFIKIFSLSFESSPFLSHLVICL